MCELGELILRYLLQFKQGYFSLEKIKLKTFQCIEME